MRRKFQRGAATVEMTLVGIPLIFTLISIFEISRGMWMYHTMVYAVKEGVRFASVHGLDCVNNPPTVLNNCSQSQAAIAEVIQQAGVGLSTTATTLTFCAPAANPGNLCATGSTTCALNACSAAGYWPPINFNGIGQTIEIDIKTPFRSALAMFWPGAHRVSFAETQLIASSSAQIQF